MKANWKRMRVNKHRKIRPKKLLWKTEWKTRRKIRLRIKFYNLWPIWIEAKEEEQQKDTRIRQKIFLLHTLISLLLVVAKQMRMRNSTYKLRLMWIPNFPEFITDFLSSELLYYLKHLVFLTNGWFIALLTGLLTLLHVA